MNSGERRDDRSQGEKQSAEVHEAHQASVNQVRREPVPASHHDEHGRTESRQGEATPSGRARDAAERSGQDGETQANGGPAEAGDGSEPEHPPSH